MVKSEDKKQIKLVTRGEQGRSSFAVERRGSAAAAGPSAMPDDLHKKLSRRATSATWWSSCRA